MSQHVVIVESPAKCRTIGNYLGKGYKVLASYGHVRDLLARDGAVSIDDDFSMQYEEVDRNSKYVAAIARELKNAESLILATDPDREGEAISWHLLELLKKKRVLKDKKILRISFNEITESAVQQALNNPRPLSSNLVDAQQARRALDHLVGFKVSPILWRNIKTGLSAGRVQSPALRMIVEREKEIEAFVPREYWTLTALFDKDGQQVEGKLVEWRGSRVAQFTIDNAETAEEAQSELRAAARESGLVVSDVKTAKVKRSPPPPLITSTLQQDAVRRLGMSVQSAMRTAQQLYEGVPIDGRAVALITYMRTDSLTLSREAEKDLRQAIGEGFSADYLPARPRLYKTKAKNAQEAHEAIRPISASRYPPQKIRNQLSPEQFRLYDLIWRRSLACQMADARFERTTLTLSCGVGNAFRVVGSYLEFPGYLAVYQADDGKDAEPRLPLLQVGESLNLRDIRGRQSFTEPPPRYNEGSLVKTLEGYSIGRPSTYGPIIDSLKKRNYVEMDQRRFIPTDIGRLTNDFLTENFADYVDYDFTARLEGDLDKVASGDEKRSSLLKSFWAGLEEKIENERQGRSSKNWKARQLGVDPNSGESVFARLGRYGPYVQLGEYDDGDKSKKPKMASLPPEFRLETVTLEQALAILRFPRPLGDDGAGNEITVNLGRFGPYLRCAGQSVSIGQIDPLQVTREEALRLIKEKKEADSKKLLKEFEGSDVRILRGPFGPYVTNNERKNVRLPAEWRDRPQEMPLDTALELIEKAPAKKGRQAAARKTGARSKPASRVVRRKKTASHA